MSDSNPELTKVTSKGQITIPSKIRKKYEINKGDQLVVIPVDNGLILKKIDIPSIEEFKKRIEQRNQEIGLDEIEELVHKKRGLNE